MGKGGKEVRRGESRREIKGRIADREEREERRK